MKRVILGMGHSVTHTICYFCCSILRFQIGNPNLLKSQIFNP